MSSHFRQSEAQEAAEESSRGTETLIRGAAYGSSQKVTGKREQLGTCGKEQKVKDYLKRHKKSL